MSNFFGIETKNIRVEIEDHEGVKSGMVIELCPPSDRRARRAERKIQDMMVAGARKKNHDVAEMVLTRLVARVVGWEYADDAQWCGNPMRKVEYSEEACRRLFEDPDFEHVRDQVADAIGDQARFFRSADNDAD